MVQIRTKKAKRDPNPFMKPNGFLEDMKRMEKRDKFIHVMSANPLLFALFKDRIKEFEDERPN